MKNDSKPGPKRRHGSIGKVIGESSAPKKEVFRESRVTNTLPPPANPHRNGGKNQK